MAIPSLAMIPSGYKDGKVYSVLPSNGDGYFTFSRGSSATRVNKDGLIEVLAFDIPRLDYTDGSCPSLLLEPQSTNLVTYSEDFSDSSWLNVAQGSGSAAVVTDNYAISPDGTQNASRLQCDLNGGVTSSANQSLIANVYSNSGNQTISVYLKSNKGQNQTIYFANTQTSGDTVTITSEWQRFEFSHNTSNYVLAVGLRGRSGGAIDDAADILIWGAQAEQQSYPTSYIPTNGTTVTRAAETANGSGDAATFNDSEGVLMFESSSLLNNGSDTRISISDGTVSNRIEFSYGNGNNQIYVLINIGGTPILYTVTEALSNLSEFKKFAFKIKSGDSGFYINGFKVLTSTTTFTNYTMSELKFTNTTDAIPFYGNTKQIQYYNSALTDSELEELTSWESFLEMAEGQQYKIK